MLPDRERHELRAIEEELRSSDPAFAAALSQNGFRELWRWKLLEILADVTAVLMIVVGVFAGHADLVLWGTLSTAGLIVLWLARRK